MTTTATAYRPTFEASLSWGQIGEGRIANWLKGKGWSILPVYEKEIDNGKGPRLFIPGGELVAPDMLAYNMTKTPAPVRWIEAKTKTRFSWYGIKQRWVTGIDLRHYTDYCKIDDASPFPVWLMFLHDNSNAWPHDVERWHAPPSCPTGLFGEMLSVLRQTESHRSDKHGKSGMVYWADTSLRRLAPVSEVK